MSIEAVATRAGVGKATIYRRYDGKDALVAAALAIIQRGVERGELRADLDTRRALEMLVGAIIFRVLFGGGAIADLPETIASYVDLLIEGAAPDA